MATETTKLTSMQLLRGIAIILVIHCHILDFQLDINSFTYQSHFFYLQNFGAIGVDLFFVISGFIITIVSLKYAKSSSPIDFILKRIIRIVPLYWLVSLLFSVNVFFRTEYWPDIRSIIATIIFSPSTPILSLGWTLSFEMFFYVVITTCIIANKHKYILLTTLIILAFIIFNYLTHRKFYLIIFLGNGIILEFLMGIGVAGLYLSKIILSRGLCIAIIIIGIAGMLLTLTSGFGAISEMWHTVSGELSLERSLIWGVPCALLAAGLTMLQKVTYLHIPQLWITIGDASFSLYLIHVIVLYNLYYVFRLLNLQKTIQGDVLVIIVMAVTLMGGWIFYKWIELPFLKWFDINKVKLFFEKKPKK